MKIIEAMKQVKMLDTKVGDLRSKIKDHAADYQHETPVYKNQEAQIVSWLQSCHDTVQEIERLRVAIQATNLATMVTIELGGKNVTKSIAAWIHRRRDLAKIDATVESMLTDRGLKEGTLQTSSGGQQEVKIRRYYDPATRDKLIEMYRNEPMIIDSTLEVINAITDLIE